MRRRRRGGIRFGRRQRAARRHDTPSIGGHQDPTKSTTDNPAPPAQRGWIVLPAIGSIARSVAARGAQPRATPDPAAPRRSKRSRSRLSFESTVGALELDVPVHYDHKGAVHRVVTAVGGAWIADQGGRVVEIGGWRAAGFVSPVSVPAFAIPVIVNAGPDHQGNEVPLAGTAVVG